MAPSKKVSLDDHQRFVLMKFRRNVSDVTKPYHDDQFLLRWLRARNWNPEAAEKMLRQSLRWREQWEVDGALKVWKAPEAVENYYPSGTSGYDKEGSPIIIIPFAGLDVIGLLHSCSKQDLTKKIIQEVEMYVEMAMASGARKVIAIFDMDGFNLRQYAWRPAAELVISLLQIYEANYPEILKACYIINAPRVFAIAFNVVKRFLNELTIGKIEIYKSDPKKWQKVLLQHIDADNLPKYYGGNLVDPDGNPKYTTKIRQGAKVPKSFYKKNFEKGPETSSNYTSVVIKKGGKLSLDFIVAEDGSFLKWDFKTDGHDIRFGVTMKDVEGNITSPIRLRRVAAHQMDETGVITCKAPATYTVVFDNSYSILRSKKLHYNVEVTRPLDDLEISADEEGAEAATTSDTRFKNSASNNNTVSVR